MRITIPLKYCIPYLFTFQQLGMNYQLEQIRPETYQQLTVRLSLNSPNENIKGVGFREYSKNIKLLLKTTQYWKLIILYVEGRYFELYLQRWYCVYDALNEELKRSNLVLYLYQHLLCILFEANTECRVQEAVGLSTAKLKLFEEAYSHRFMDDNLE